MKRIHRSNWEVALDKMLNDVVREDRRFFCKDSSGRLVIEIYAGNTRVVWAQRATDVVRYTSVYDMESFGIKPRDLVNLYYAAKDDPRFIEIKERAEREDMEKKRIEAENKRIWAEKRAKEEAEYAAFMVKMMREREVQEAADRAKREVTERFSSFCREIAGEYAHIIPLEHHDYSENTGLVKIGGVWRQVESCFGEEYYTVRII